MKYLITLVAILLATNTQAQKLTVYPDVYSFNGQPKLVKQYAMAADETENNRDYFLIEYNYEEQIRTISYYYKFPQQTEYKKEWEKTQSIKSEDLEHTYVYNYRYPFNRRLIIDTKEVKDDGTIVLNNYNYDSRIEQHTDGDGRVIIENLFDKNSVSTGSIVHAYSTDGKIRYSHRLNSKGEKISDAIIKHDEHNNPVWVKGIMLNGDEYSFQTKYEYDEYGNFTSAVETENGKVNRKIIRDIRY